MAEIFSLTVEASGLARVVFDLPEQKVNKWNRAVLARLRQLTEELGGHSDIRALLFESAKRSIFVAGADLKELAVFRSPEEAAGMAAEGQGIFNEWAALAFPTVAVIDGACLGGGLEFALACTHRIASDDPKTIFGQPEVTLGIIPGFGGTQRLPRQVGLDPALTMIVGGKPLGASQAADIGLVDAIADREHLGTMTASFVEELLEGNVGDSGRAMESGEVGQAFEQAGKLAQKTDRSFGSAPSVALEVIHRTWDGSLEEGLAVEAEEFGKITAGASAKNLMQLFFTREQLRKDSGVTVPLKPALPTSAGVVGGGVMGSGIAWLLSNALLPTRLKEVDDAACKRAVESVEKIYDDLVNRGRLGEEDRRNRFGCLLAGTNDTGFGELDIVVEAVIENADIKRKVFTALEAVMAEDAVIASNTSTLSITEMAADLRRPDRFIGMHFFNPVNRMLLVEVIPGEQTSQQVTATVVAFAKRLGKTPIVVSSCPGFLMNRVLYPYLNEAILILQEGGDLSEVDDFLRDFGMPMGPFRLLDEVGLDVFYSIAGIMEAAYGTRMAMAPMLRTLHVDKGLVGRKGGAGFYVHEGRKFRPNPDLTEALEAYRRDAGISPRAVDSNEACDRILLSMLNELCRCLEESVIERPDYADMALILGLGFPSVRGGLLQHADRTGIAEIVDRLEQLAADHGDRFAPAKHLCDLSDSNATFYG